LPPWLVPLLQRAMKVATAWSMAAGSVMIGAPVPGSCEAVDYTRHDPRSV
jgi:hypothetical protein